MIFFGTPYTTIQWLSILVVILSKALYSESFVSPWTTPSTSATKTKSSKLLYRTNDPTSFGGEESSTNDRSERRRQQQEEDLFDLNDEVNDDTKELVKSVNYFISRKCNYACKFCFHTQKTTHHLALEQAKLGLRLLKDAGTEKINFAGGEPFYFPELLGQLCKIASNDLDLAVSIISNGSLITREWMEEYGRYVDVLGVSVDSFHDATNAAIGRGEGPNSNKNNHLSRIFKVREWCYEQDIIFKVNTVVCSKNWEEDMTENIRKLNPKRWKVFQVLLLEDENMGNEQNLRDARPLVVTDEEFQSFVERHKAIPQMIPESNEVMQNSYLLLDEDMRFLDCSGGGKIPGESILKVGVHRALQQAGFDHGMFKERGGVFDWKRDRN